MSLGASRMICEHPCQVRPYYCSPFLQIILLPVGSGGSTSLETAWACFVPWLCRTCPALPDGLEPVTASHGQHWCRSCTHCHPGNSTTFLDPSLPWTSSVHPQSILTAWSVEAMDGEGSCGHKMMRAARQVLPCQRFCTLSSTSGGWKQ